MKQTITLYADEGMILTNGENYGRIIYLAEGEDKDKYREITETEYEKLNIEKYES